VLAALPNPRVPFEWCFGDDFPAGNDFVFVDFFSVNKGCDFLRIHASPLEGVSEDHFPVGNDSVSLTFSESTVAGNYFESTRHL
jgi:hypothetical protein